MDMTPVNSNWTVCRKRTLAMSVANYELRVSGLERLLQLGIWIRESDENDLLRKTAE